ncbi:NUDIX hydrolase [Pseudaeromonas paramecii]|uniref:Phosphatase NudJ n=2 Tax=Pseudaeromonas paramecii TaxID=2138166 RepID=A0ABP8QG88_9GAMM
MNMRFRPNVTVAAIIRWQDRYLLVEEQERNGRHVFNQPAGHLEHGENLIEAVMREVQEETGLTLTPDGWVGTYLFSTPYRKLTYLRFCFYCELTQAPGDHAPQDPDNDILACHWLTMPEIRKLGRRLRSPLVMECFEDYLSGVRLPLASLKDRRFCV